MAKDAPKVKVAKDGPYVVSGGLPLSRQLIVRDSEGDPLRWKQGRKVKAGKRYLLCRCGRSKEKPFCDNMHLKARFNGKETASRMLFSKAAETLKGPDLLLKDNESLCSGTGFCHRASGTWNLTMESDNPRSRETAIQQACDCPSGRLVACEKTGKPIEKDTKKSIGLVEEITGKLNGPLWVRGGITLEGSDGKKYEVRNRMALCRCGRSRNKPFCDGAHFSVRS